MTSQEALRLLNLAHAHHREGRPVPAEILDKRREVEEATRHAELFLSLFRVVDENMVQRAVGLRLELDALYAAWTRDEIRSRPTLH